MTLTLLTPSKPKLITTLGAALSVCLLQSGCGGGGEGAKSSTGSSAKVTIQNKGSDTMVNLAQAWAEEYREGGAGRRAWRSRAAARASASPP